MFKMYGMRRCGKRVKERKKERMNERERKREREREEERKGGREKEKVCVCKRDERKEYSCVCVREKLGRRKTRREKEKCTMDFFEATKKIRGVVDRVFRARGAVGAQKMLCRRASPLYFRLII